MILVVLGHIYDPNGPEWANTFRKVIYSFHMPFFMYLSGYIFIYTGNQLTREGYTGYFLKRANRLLVPFFALAIVIIGGKFVASYFVSVNKPVNDLFSSLYHVLFSTEKSPVLTIWYLFVLFVFSVITPVVLRVVSFSAAMAIAVGMHLIFLIAIYNERMPSDFYVDRIFMFYVFFMAGCLAAHHMTVWEDVVQRWWGIAFAVFVVTVFITIDHEYRYILAGMASIPALHGLVRWTILDDSKFLLWLGDNAFTIYLFNTIFIGVVRGLVALAVVPSQHMVLLYALSLPAGLLGPILLRYLMVRLPVGRRVVPWIA